ncbi:Right handed beta helix region [uncultured archaeon]|nr:Right handed beta helix region [uncultured archaeon]
MIVVGYTKRSLGGDTYHYDYYIIKYDENGNHLWNKSIDTGSEDGDYAKSVAVDTTDNIIVTGYNESGFDWTLSEDYYTIKLNSAGTAQWNRTFRANSRNFANSIDTDTNNNILVTGASSGTTSYTVKYDANGNPLWNASNTESASSVANYGVTTNSNDDVFVTDSQNRLIKYNSSGNHQWNVSYSMSGGAGPDAIDTDSNGNIYFAGTAGTDFRTYKFDSSGNQKWNITTSAGTNDYGHGLAVDSSKNVITTGSTLTGGNFDFFTIKYGQVFTSVCGIEPVESSITLTQNYISNGSTGDCVEIIGSNLVFDCAGYSLTGINQSNGIFVSNANNVAIINCNIQNFTTGINITNAQSYTVNLTNITDVEYGIWVDPSTGKMAGVNIAGNGDGTGITIENSNNNIIRGPTITDFYVGIDIDNSDDTTIGSDVRPPLVVATEKVPTISTGVRIKDSNDVTVKDAIIHTFDTAVSVTDSDNFLIESAEISKYCTGIFIDPSENGSVTKTTFDASDSEDKPCGDRISIYIWDTQDVLLSYINITGNNSANGTGIKIINSSINISNSNVTGNGTGTGVNVSKSKLRVDDTLVEDYLYGIYISSDSTDVSITNSKIRNMITSPPYAIYNLGSGTGSNNYCTSTYGWSDGGYTNRCTYQPDYTNSPEWWQIPGLDYARSTDLSQEPDRSSVADLTFASPTVTVIWQNNVDTSYQDYDQNVYIGTNFVSINSANLDASINTPATVEMAGIDCNNFKVYYASGFQTSFAEVVSEGQAVATEENIDGDCNDASICTDVQCTDFTLTFTAQHFSGFAGANATTLEIWDDTDTITKYVDEQVGFYANYSNASIPITGASCNASFETAPSGPAIMTYNSTSKYYEYNRTFTATGTSDWNVTCEKTAFPTLTALDEVTISPQGDAVPEFSTYTLLITLLIAVGGLVLVRNRYR